MRRFPTGTTDQYIYFVAVDATDFVTRETGFGGSGWTVIRSRNGAADAAYTTPTVSEIDGTTMPGVYALLLDEDMTIGSGNDSEEVCLHITHSGMAPVTMIYELYRREVTGGETLTVSSGNAAANVTQAAGTNVTASGGRLEVNTTHAAGTAWNSGAIAASTLAGDAITAAKVASDVGTEIGTAVWATTTRVLTAGTNIALAKGTGVTGFNDLDAAGVRGAVGLASANLDTQLSTIDGVVDDILVDTAVIGAAGAGLTAIPWNAAWDAEVQSEVTDALAAYDPPTKAELDSAVSPLATSSDLATVDANVDAIKAKTDDLTFGVAGVLNANITHVNEVEVTGDGEPWSEWGPAV